MKQIKVLLFKVLFWSVYRKRAVTNRLGSLSVKTPPSLTSEEVQQDLFEHRFMDLRVGDGVQQLPLLLVGKDELTQLLPVDLPVVEQDLRPEVVDDARVGMSVWLHDCFGTITIIVLIQQVMSQITFFKCLKNIYFNIVTFQVSIQSLKNCTTAKET